MKGRAPLTQWQRIKSVYPYLYTISYRASRWSAASFRKDAAGALAVSLVNMMLAFAALMAFSDWLGMRRVPSWTVIPFVAVLLGAQYLLFDRPELGPRFEKRFDGLSSGERWGIGFYAAGLVLVAGALFIVTIGHHRHLIGVS